MKEFPNIHKDKDEIKKERNEMVQGITKEAMHNASQVHHDVYCKETDTIIICKTNQK